MSRQLERFLKIDALLRSGQRHTAAALAEQLEVSERTVLADIAFMRDRFDAPMDYTKSKGWHYTDSSWSLPTMPLSQGEVFVLTLGAKMLAAYGGTPFQQELESALAQLAKRLPKEVAADLGAIAQQRVMFHPGASVQINPDVWQKLEFACQAMQSVRLHYFAATRNTETERVVDPYLLTFARTNPYLTGFCHLRQDIRDFRIDRIRAIEVLTSAFEIDPNFDPKCYLETPFLHERGGDPITVRIWFDAASAPFIEERYWHSTQQITKNDDGSLILSFEARSLPEVKRWLLFYGKGAIALEPPELIALVREEIVQMNYNYSNSFADGESRETSC